MKFLCGNCKAKYQIADEKVSGRTLRMKCRRCGHDILIDGHSMAPQSAPHPAPQPRRPGGSSVSVVPPATRATGTHAVPARAAASPGLPRPSISRSKPPTGLSADFRRHVAAPPEVPQRTAPYDLWHVAIQDVPVGPMTRDELSRKIDAGAVTPESLCWREGMDDWRPLGELPELAGLLRRSREGLRPSRHRPPPEVPATHGSRAAPLPTDAEDEEDGAEPTRISEFQPPPTPGSVAGPLPTAGHGAHAPHSASGSASPRVMAAAGSDAGVPMQPPVQAVAPAQSKSAGPLSGGLLLSIGLLIGIGLGLVVFLLFRGDPAPAPAPMASAPVERAERPREEPVDLEVQPMEEETQDEPAAPSARAPSRSPGARAKAPAPDNKNKPLSDEQRRLLERMGGGANDPDLSRMQGRPIEGGGGGGNAALQPSLTPQQLTKVVQDNKTQLQRCYETALRAAGGKQEGAIKISVSVVVGGSGTAKSVNTQGDGLGNMTDCIRQAVRRWRFPQSGGDSEFAFPLVFQPGA